MRSKVTFLLLALNLVLFGYLVLSERPWAKPTGIEANRKRVLGPEAANLVALEIAAFGAGGDTPTETIRLKKRADRGDGWMLAAPVDWPANTHAVTPILTALQFLEHETSFLVADLAAEGRSLADYGLQNPRLIVTATPAPVSADAPAPTPFVLRIGDGAAVGKNLYVLSPDGARIHVVGPALLESLAAGLDQLRSDRVFTIPVFEARALTLQTAAANSTRTRLRREPARWIFEAPITARAAKTPVELLINDLNTLRVSRFLPAGTDAARELADLVASPRLRLTLEGNGRRETLLLGRPVGDAPVGDAPTEFHARLDDRPTLFTVAVPSEVLKTLDSAQTALRDPRILDFDPALVTAITLAPPEGAPPGPLRIQKLDASPGAPAAWQAASPALATPLRADPDLVARLLKNLQLIEAVAPPAPGATPFVSDAPSRLELEKMGFNRPERAVTLQLAQPPPNTLVLELASPGGGDSGLYARVASQPFIYAVPPETIYLFDLAPRSWRDRSLARLPDATKITRLVLRRAEGNAAPLLDHTPSDTPPPAVVGTLLAAVRDLRAKAILREDFPAGVPVDGVEKPWSYVLEATLDSAAESPLVIHLAERSGGMTQQAGSQKLGLVFTLEQPVLDALWTLLYAPRDVAAP
jgi:hypothetical protein